MIDTAIIAIIPPVVAAILTYVVANKRARIQYAKVIADMQSRAVELVAAQEEKMRKEIWDELALVRSENKALRDDLSTLKEKLQTAHDLSDILREEVKSLRSALDVTSKELDRSKLRIVELEENGKSK